MCAPPAGDDACCRGPSAAAGALGRGAPPRRGCRIGLDAGKLARARLPQAARPECGGQDGALAGRRRADGRTCRRGHSRWGFRRENTFSRIAVTTRPARNFESDWWTWSGPLKRLRRRFRNADGIRNALDAVLLAPAAGRLSRRMTNWRRFQAGYLAVEPGRQDAEHVLHITTAIRNETSGSVKPPDDGALCVTHPVCGSGTADSGCAWRRTPSRCLAGLGLVDLDTAFACSGRRSASPVWPATEIGRI